MPTGFCCLQEAAEEKARAGEGRNVEHVALADEHVPEPSKPRKRSQRRQPSAASAARNELTDDRLVPNGSLSRQSQLPGLKIKRPANEPVPAAAHEATDVQLRRSKRRR